MAYRVRFGPTEPRVGGLVGLAPMTPDVHGGPVGPIPDPVGPVEVSPPLL